MSILSWLLGKEKSPEQARFDRLSKNIESPIEGLFWREGYNTLSKVGKFTPQVEIEGYRLDFALTDIPNVPLLKVAIELDGHEFHSSQEQRNKDAVRDRTLGKKNWKVVRFTGSEINGDCAWCVRETVELVRAWTRWLR